MALALDSSAVIGFLDRSDVHHEAADAAMRTAIGDEALIVSVISYAEVLTGARLGHHSEVTVAGFFEEIVSEVVPVSPEVADRAATLRSIHEGIRLPDALIAATAELHPDVHTLLTGDRSLARLNQLDCSIQLLASR